MRAITAFVALASSAVSAAFAGDGVAEEVRAAVARNDRAAAVAILESVISPGVPRDRRRSVEAARAATDLVGGPEGDLVAARILVDTLSDDASDRESAKAVALGLRKRVKDVDLPAAQELFRGLARIYPGDLEYAMDLAKTYLHSGLSEPALAEYGRIASLAPSARDVRYQLALLHRDRCELAAAAADYDALIRLGEEHARPDLTAHLYKGWLMLREVHDCDAARAALEAGLAAAANSPDRDTFLPQFEELRGVIAEEEQRRRALHALSGHLDAALWGVFAAWAVVLGGGVLCLRRTKWI